MGRKPKYSSVSNTKINFRMTEIQLQVLQDTQKICKAKGLPHTQHDVFVAGLQMYYDYLFKNHQKQIRENAADINASAITP